jgi:hypothetical protein
MLGDRVTTYAETATESLRIDPGGDGGRISLRLV